MEVPSDLIKRTDGMMEPIRGKVDIDCGRVKGSVSEERFDGQQIGTILV